MQLTRATARRLLAGATATLGLVLLSLPAHALSGRGGSPGSGGMNAPSGAVRPSMPGRSMGGPSSFAGPVAERTRPVPVNPGPMTFGPSLGRPGSVAGQGLAPRGFTPAPRTLSGEVGVPSSPSRWDSRSVQILPPAEPRSLLGAPRSQGDAGQLLIRPHAPSLLPEARGPREMPQATAPHRLLPPPAALSQGRERGTSSPQPRLGTQTVASPALQQQRLRSFVNQSRTFAPASPLAGRLTPNLAGRLGATTLDRLHSRFVGDTFRNNVGSFGQPQHQFFFVPRDPRFFRDFDADDPFVFRNFDGDDFFFHHHRAVFLDFFFPFFIDDPFLFGATDVSCFPSPFFFYGWTPGWIDGSQGYYNPAAYAPRDSYGGYSALDYRGAAAAIADIRHSWLDNDADRLAAHLSDQYDIQVYLDGQYRYTTSNNDFYEMTLDTLSTTRTASLDFADPIWIAPDQVLYTGTQVFTDPDGATRTVYVSYRLQQVGYDWYLIGYGSSLDPIQSQYQDFRY